MKRFALALLSVGFFASCSPKKPDLQILCWADYISPAVLQKFMKEYDCTVTVTPFESNGDELTKLRPGTGGYDVCFVSDDYVRAFVDQGVLVKLDSPKLANKKNLMARHTGQAFDPKNEYTIPFFWGTTGIAYNKEQVQPAPTSWNDLWNDKWKNRVSLVKDSREAIGAALRCFGLSVNDTKPESLARAKEKILAHKKISVMITSEPKDALISGELWICQCFSGDAIQARAAGKPIGYVVPQEGGTLWIDSMAVPKGGKHPDLAHKFIDFVLRPDIGAELADFNGYASPNEAAQTHIRKELLGDPVVNPSEEILKRCEHLKVLTDEEFKRIEATWNEAMSK